MKTNPRNVVIPVLLATCLWFAGKYSFGQEYELTSSNIVSGGGSAAVGTLNLWSSLGQFDAGQSSLGPYSVSGGFLTAPDEPVLLGDINLDGVVSLLDVSPFVQLISSAGFQLEADVNQDGEVNLLDVDPFVDILTGG